MSAPKSPVSSEILEQHLDAFLPPADAFPEALHRAMRYAVFSGGKLMRPRLTLAVAAAWTPPTSPPQDGYMLAVRAACAIEYVHAASLVHDDLPCFDGAPMRRGKPSVQAQFGEAMAVLVGDALLSRAIEVLADVPPAQAGRAVRILRMLGQSTGSSSGIIGGQSLETQYSTTDWQAAVPGSPSYAAGTLGRYHSMKTAALFRLAAEAGAVAVGAAESSLCAEAGYFLGLAYQLVDDLNHQRLYREGQAASPGNAQAAVSHSPNAVQMCGEVEILGQMDALLKRARRLSTAIGHDPQPVLSLIDEVDQWVKLLTGKAS